MIITADTGRWYEKLMEEHEQKTSEAPANSGTRKAHSVIGEELKQMYLDKTLRFTPREAMILLCAKIRLVMHTLTETSGFNAEKKDVYYRFLASHSKFHHETPQSIFQAVSEYIFNGNCKSPMQAYCIGTFVQYAVYGNNYINVHPIITLPYLREWILNRIDFFEALNIDYATRQESISAYIYILGIFH